MLPLAEREGSLEDYGTRHRAALGVTEQTDAVAIVVSEETGLISVAHQGRLQRRLNEKALRSTLVGLFQEEKEQKAA